MLIDPFRSDLLAGYKRIRFARLWLLGKWRFKLLQAYSKRWEQFAQAAARQEVRKSRYKKYLPWVGIGLLILCAGGYWLTLASFCFGSVLILASVLAGSTAMVTWVVFSRKPKAPENPVAQNTKNKSTSPLKQKLFPDLVPIWRQGMAARIPSVGEVDEMANETGIWGLIGEFDLVRELAMIVSPNTFILHRLNQIPGDDLDVVVIGPKGFWYFEVKHHNAHFEWQNGTWNIWRLDHKTRTHVRVNMSQDPDAQWSRMRKDALKTLELHGRDLSAKAPRVADIKGGLVFSNANAALNIQEPAPFDWGTIPAWMQKYREAPRLREMTPRVILQLVELLTKRHQELNPNSRVYSMETHVTKVLKDVEGKIQAWIDAS
jgi:hypothetical protein